MRNGGISANGTIKVIIVDMPGLLAAMVRQVIEAEMDMEIAGQVDTPEALTQAMARSVDVIVTADDGSNLAPHLRAALFSRRAVPVVAISADGNSIDVYERWATQGYGVAGLIGLIREAVAGAKPRCGS